jgi:3-phenylpropionate/trans-cinnamate dioxygenase ferredoxin reductase subunit
MDRQTFVIVGASLAGAKAAEELRTHGFDGRIVLVGDEPERPYERPPLTKDYLRGESERSKLYVHPADFYEQHDIELLTGMAVIRIDPYESRVWFSDGRQLAYDKLLLTTGAEPRQLPLDHGGSDNIHYLRTAADCDRLRARLEDSGHVAVVGAGWIGSEFAASARQRGLEVTMIDPLALPNERIFGAEVGTFYRDLHARHGVRLRLGEAVEGFERSAQGLMIRTSAGQVDCDFAVVGAGVVPRIELARDAGIAVENGIIVGEQLETSVPGIFAAGDVANAWHRLYDRRIRVEHWANALNQGPAAARAMLGDDVVYDRIPYFFSDQYDVGMEYSGYAERWEEVVFRGERDSGEFVALWLDEGRVVAGMNVNVWDVNQHVQSLIRSGEPVDVGELTDPDTPLEAIVGDLARVGRNHGPGES